MPEIIPTIPPVVARGFNSENLRKAFMSILVGAAVSLLTVLFQGILDYIKHMGPEVPAATVAIAHHLFTWKTPPQA